MDVTPDASKVHPFSRHATASKRVRDLSWPSGTLALASDDLRPCWDLVPSFNLGEPSSDPPDVPPEDISNLKQVTFGPLALVPLALLPLAWNE